MQKSKKVKSKHGRCKWYDVLEDMVVTYPLDTEEVPDIFVYLTRGRDRICFKRFRMEALIRQGWRVPPAWIVFQEDTALDKLSAEECPGSILASLRAGTCVLRMRLNAFVCRCLGS